ncbi:MAG: hypothetical protein CM15mP85_04770 [Rhodobacterales bacterium]|nr:MAG: hypothetical protein CM15mP85_04770 [Rhodobacterales bacterium]
MRLQAQVFAQFFEDGFTIKDVRNNIIWLRCTVGQNWDYDANTCIGDIVKLNHDEIDIAKMQAAEQLGGVMATADFRGN